ncbi:MAG: CYTH domain-containing protein [Nanoarchaeota archaeon]
MTREKDIEVEVRSFISAEKYLELLNFFQKEAAFVSEDNQETYYFDAPQDLRIQKNNFFSKIWMKRGRIHDDCREEIEIRFPREDFEKLEKLFVSLGFAVQIKWFRKRHTFQWEKVEVMLDFTKGYGHIIELEKKSDEAEKELVLQELKEKLQQLSLPLTPKEEFDQRYQYYKEHWRELV